jgi:hypothetical protein
LRDRKVILKYVNNFKTPVLEISFELESEKPRRTRRAIDYGSLRFECIVGAGFRRGRGSIRHMECEGRVVPPFLYWLPLV